MSHKITIVVEPGTEGQVSMQMEHANVLDLLYAMCACAQRASAILTDEGAPHLATAVDMAISPVKALTALLVKGLDATVDEEKGPTQ